VIGLTATGIGGAVAVDTGRLAVAANGAGTYYAIGSIVKPLSGTIGAKLLGITASAVTAGKLLYDAGLYIDAVIACSQDPTLQ
jgi:hypothetical protein